jgi:hypothetical protein
MGQLGRSLPDQPLRIQNDMADWLTDSFEHEIGKTDLGRYSYGGFAARSLRKLAITACAEWHCCCHKYLPKPLEGMRPHEG